MSNKKMFKEFFLKPNFLDEFSKSWDVDNFFSELGSGSAGQVSSEDEGDDDEAHERAVERETTLFRGMLHSL